MLAIHSDTGRLTDCTPCNSGASDRRCTATEENAPGAARSDTSGQAGIGRRKRAKNVRFRAKNDQKRAMFVQKSSLFCIGKPTFCPRQYPPNCSTEERGSTPYHTRPVVGTQRGPTVQSGPAGAPEGIAGAGRHAFRIGVWGNILSFRLLQTSPRKALHARHFF